MLIVFPCLIVTGLNLKLIQHFREHHFSFREGRQPNSTQGFILSWEKNQRMLLHEKKLYITLSLFISSKLKVEVVFCVNA